MARFAASSYPPARPIIPKPRREIGFFEFLRQSQENPLRNWTAEAFEEGVIYNRLLFTRFILLNEPECIRHVLTDNAANYHKSVIGLRLLKRGLGNGLLTSEDDVWLRQRRIINPAFHHSRLKIMAEIMVAETEETARLWDATAAREEERDILEDMMNLTLRIIVRTMFSSDIGPAAADVHTHLSRIQELTGRPAISDLFGLPDWIPRPRARRAEASQRVLDEIVGRLIRARRDNPGEQGDLLDMLMSARDEKSGQGMSDRQIRDEVMTIYAAGHETTANALTWTMYLVSQHPEVEGRLLAEWDGVLGGRPPLYDDARNLAYTRQVIDEALRLYPPAHTFGRHALGPDRVGSYDIPRGAEVMIAPWVLHRHKRLWEAPERFDPDRFRPEAVRARHPYAYLPFGGGPRTCIGKNFALVEAQLALVSLLQRYRARLAPGFPVEPVALITLRPRWGMVMRLTRRA